MVDGPSAPVNTGPNLHALGLLDGARNNAEQPLDVNGASELGDLFKEGINKVPDNIVKLLQTIPLVGGFLAGLIPLRAGQQSAFSSFESQGFLAKNINQMQGMQGGLLARTAFGEVFKNKAITSQLAGLEAPQWGGSMQNASGADYFTAAMAPMNTPAFDQGRGSGMDFGAMS